MTTVSEQLYARYCELLDYPSEPISVGPLRTPDRLVKTPHGEVVAEVKELTPNEDDARQLRELQERGCTHGGGTPGRRVFEKIRDAASQLRAHAERQVPCMLVLFDNIRAGGWRIGSQHLEPAAIDFGMYGLQTVLLAPESPTPGARLVAVAAGRGGRRQMAEDARRYISALQVLSESPGEESVPFVFTYHNYFAGVRLSYDVFRGPRDRHFAKPRHPDECPQLWQEVVSNR